jgi:sugar phosphate isomerase/epimerase
VHDNHGMRDEHLWPGEGTINWAQTAELLKALPTAPAQVLEIGYSLGDTADAVPTKIQAGFEKLV